MVTVEAAMNPLLHTHITCRECGKDEELIWDAPKNRDLKASQLCFYCEIWQHRWVRRNSTAAVVVGGQAYWIVPDKPGAPHGMLGYGGRPWYIAFHDGRRVKSCNLWHEGEIPPHWRERLPDNAVFLTEAEFNREAVDTPANSELLEREIPEDVGQELRGSDAVFPVRGTQGSAAGQTTEGHAASIGGVRPGTL